MNVARFNQMVWAMIGDEEQMNNWIRIGTRYINLDSIAVIHILPTTITLDYGDDRLHIKEADEVETVKHWLEHCAHAMVTDLNSLMVKEEA